MINYNYQKKRLINPPTPCPEPPTILLRKVFEEFPIKLVKKLSGFT
jgi:hypothetical protein